MSLFLKTVFEAPSLRRYLEFLIFIRPKADIQNFFERLQDYLNAIDLPAYSHTTSYKTFAQPYHDIDTPSYLRRPWFRLLLVGGTWAPFP